MLTKKQILLKKENNKLVKIKVVKATIGVSIEIDKLSLLNKAKNFYDEIKKAEYLGRVFYESNVTAYLWTNVRLKEEIDGNKVVDVDSWREFYQDMVVSSSVREHINQKIKKLEVGV